MNLKVQHFKIGLNNFVYQNTRMLRENRRPNKIEECHERSIMACLKLLLNEKPGLSAMYPNNSIHLMSTAAVLPLSTAEVERVFS
jgi:hypothetical protein